MKIGQTFMWFIQKWFRMIRERITTASYVLQSHSAKEERVALLPQPNPSKMKLYYTISDPGLFITCFLFFRQEKLISFDEDIWASRLAPSHHPLWMWLKLTILLVNAKKREKWCLNESQVLCHAWCFGCSWEEDLWSIQLSVGHNVARILDLLAVCISDNAWFSL